MALYALVFMLAYFAMNAYKKPQPMQYTKAYAQLMQMVYVQHPLDISQDKFDDNTPILVYFWGDWCHICKHTTPHVINTSKHHTVIAVAVASSPASLDAKNANLVTIDDSDGALFHSFGAQVTPSYLIIKNGQIKSSFVGFSPTVLLRMRMMLASM